MKYAVVDIETTSDEVFNRTAHYMFNDIIAYGIKTDEYTISHYVVENYDIEDLISLITKNKEVVAFNAKFECLYFWEYDRFQTFLQEGGRVYCPQLAEYCLSNFQTTWAGLRDLAVNKYSLKDRVKWIETLFFEDKNTPYKSMRELPEDKVLEDVTNDINDTEVIYLKQQEMIKKRGKNFINYLNVQMDFLLATTEMEYNGMCIDLDKLKEGREELLKERSELEQEIKQIIDKHWVIYDNNQ